MVYSDGAYGLPEIYNFIVAGNTFRGATQIAGGVVYTAAHATDTTVVHFADIYGNTMSSGSVRGGVLYPAGAAEMKMVNVVGNSMAGAVTGSVLTCSSAALVDWEYSNVYDNDGTDFNVFADPTGANGNIAVDPAYVDVTSADPMDWDLALQSGSPLLDAGDPSATYDDTDGSTADIGAFGGPEGSGW